MTADKLGDTETGRGFLRDIGPKVFRKISKRVNSLTKVDVDTAVVFVGDWFLRELGREALGKLGDPFVKPVDVYPTLNFFVGIAPNDITVGIRQFARVG